MKKNIILITDYAAPYEGNFIASLKSLEKVMLDKEYSIKFLFPTRANNIEWVKNFILEHNVDFFDEEILSVIKAINKSIKNDLNENVLYSHFARHKTQMAIKIFRILHPRIKLVQHFHNHCKIPNTFPKKQIMKFAYKLYEGDLNIGCSESVAKSMPYKKKKITFVTNAIDLKRLENKETTNLLKREKDKKKILMFGYDYYGKGVDLAINAIKDIANDKEIILAITLSKNKEKTESLIKTQFNQKIPDWIKLLPPTVNVCEYYNMVDIFLSASRQEGFCYSIAEAAYCGKICISSQIGGVPLHIPGMITFESENVEDLKNKILYAIEINNDKIDEARKYIINKYDLNTWANDVLKKISS